MSSEVRDVTAKPNWLLFPWRAALAVMKRIMFGAAKYKPNDWQDQETHSEAEFVEKAMRHLVAHASGEINDHENGDTHLACAATDLLMALWHQIKSKEPAMKLRPDLEPWWDRCVHGVVVPPLMSPTRVCRECLNLAMG